MWLQKTYLNRKNNNAYVKNNIVPLIYATLFGRKRNQYMWLQNIFKSEMEHCASTVSKKRKEKYSIFYFNNIIFSRENKSIYYEQ